MNRLLLWISNRTGWIGRTLSDISLIDVLEIIILAFLVYNLLLWIKNTRAWSLLKGIMFLGICVAFVYLLRMDTLIYIVNRGISIALIAALVIFQPELRKALEQIGEKQVVSSLLSLDNSRNVTERFSDRTINEIVMACVEMAKVKTGALIVIEQNVTLRDFEKTGITLDSVVSSQLLINIFEKNTPLHDGAVLIRGDRVTSATCYLPLSENRQLSKELGTRHRAGIGISEVTDSLTIIVSEETGAISVAYKGGLSRAVAPEALRERLVVLQNKSVAQRRISFWKGWSKDEA